MRGYRKYQGGSGEIRRQGLEFSTRPNTLSLQSKRARISVAMRAQPLVYLCAASIGVLLVAACTTDYQKGLEDPNFGGPNALAGQKQPGPTSEVVSDGGTSSGGGAAPECVKAGGALVDGGACAVSFKTILAAFKTANCQTAGCHGGATPQNLPRIDPDDPNGMWAEFASFKLSNGKVYINPCSTDPAQSTIGCNVNLAASCGSVMPPGVGLPANVVTDIETWLKCGAPNN